MAKTGIYSIRCLANGKIYIGSAVHLGRRWANHLSDLRKRRHPNIHLQRCSDKYGIDSLFFEVVELVDDLTILLVREQYYIDHHQAANPEFGLNIQPRAASPIGRKAREETKQKLRDAWVGRIVKLSPEGRAAIVAAGTGRKPSPKALAAMAANNAKRIAEGVSESTRQLQREAWVRRKLSPGYSPPNLNKSSVSSEKMGNIIHLYKEGFTSTQIAPIVSLSSGYVRDLLARAGVKIRPKGSQPKGRWKHV
jgi:group I intron endonuclease